ncbi:MAG: hypothetical protein HC908_14240 [Calothrix sp. SM1_7_51]|nr:hypothetical protein [Calothrix sp. SM1_7_51]
MLSQYSISLLALSLLMTIPIGIASANDIDVQNGDVRVRVSETGGIRIDSPDSPQIFIPQRTPQRTPQRILRRVPQVRLPNDRFRRGTQAVRIPKNNQILQCSGRTITSQRNTANSSVYSSSTSTLCR